MRRPIVLGGAAFAFALAFAAVTSAPAFAGEGTGAAPESGVTFEPSTLSFEDVLAKAKAQSKPAFLDFFTET